MRYIMKGGVWKNSQDQILKAAIMKYGLNQWSRISSLLQRKSAKQCKQRWYQWLDPSIKKTQWSRAQDQKLLQLARVFPSQWRTIAPFVGRTPTQCFQRYQKLLDLAQGKTGQQTEDLKRLRPGQIDPNPETKPARLDPIDMDEDQKQMLAEVRVRLANTKGKKAKRKQREKIIEEARRLAQLQKIRQLQMAGVDNIPTAKQIKRMRQKQDIDYNKDIPFKRDVPEFVYKLQQNQTSRNTFFASTISLQTLQGKRRDVEEQLQRKLDKKRIKRLKDTDYKAMMTLKNKFQKPVATPIQLPEPQLNEKDLEDMKKYNITTPLNSIIHNSTPFGMTPQNKVMLSARINYSLNHRDMMTPIGQDNQEDAVDGVKELNYLKQLQKQEKDGNKIRSVNRLISERVKTPSAHNQWQQDRNKVKSLFKNLKKPEYEVQFQISQQQEQDDIEQDKKQMDAEQLYKIQLQIQRKKQIQRLQSRNQALKMNLQRIKNIPSKLIPTHSDDHIQMLIQNQMISILYSDAIDYPLQVTVLPEQHNFKYEGPLSSEKRQSAFQLIKKQIRQSEGAYLESQYEQSYNKAKRHLKFNVTNKTVNIQKKQLGQQAEKRIKFYKQFANLQAHKQLEKANEHCEKKAKKFLGGYQKLISTKIQEVNKLEQELEKLRMLRQTLQILQQHEASSAVRRLQNEQKYYKMIYNSI